MLLFDSQSLSNLCFFMIHHFPDLVETSFISHFCVLSVFQFLKPSQVDFLFFFNLCVFADTNAFRRSVLRKVSLLRSDSVSVIEVDESFRAECRSPPGKRISLQRSTAVIIFKLQ